MIFGIVAGMLTLVPSLLLVLVDRRGDVERAVGVSLGVLGGAAAGAGVLVGAFHQPTTANIHSGYSFRSPLEWLLLSVAGAILGGVAGGALGWRLPRWRVGLAVLLVLAGLGAAGWIVSSSRTTIDCDDRQSFCEDRYG